MLFLSVRHRFFRFVVSFCKHNNDRFEFNINFTDEKVSYAIALRNGIVAITHQPNKGTTVELSKADWSKLIPGEKSFSSQDASLKAFDKAIGR